MSLCLCVCGCVCVCVCVCDENTYGLISEQDWSTQVGIISEITMLYRCTVDSDNSFIVWLQGFTFGPTSPPLSDPSDPADHHCTLCCCDICSFGNMFLNKQWCKEEITNKQKIPWDERNEKKTYKTFWDKCNAAKREPPMSGDIYITKDDLKSATW